MNSGVRQYALDCADYSDGLNTVLKASDVGGQYQSRNPVRQCVNCLNIFLHKNKRRPAVRAISSTAGRIVGLDKYLQIDGTDTLLKAQGTKLYSVNKSTGADTEIYDFDLPGETYFTTWANKCFVSNGYANVKVEGSTVYQLGISPPAGVTAAAAAGGSLPDGVYKIFAGYARRVSGVDVLYSTGQAISDITLGGGNNSILFSNFANSTDAQVGNKVIWMTEAGGSTYYRFYYTGDNTTTSFTVSDDTLENTALVYSVQAMNNDVPDPFSFVYAFDKRVWGVTDRTVYFSLQEGNVYDLERFDTTTNFITYPYKIISLFSIGPDLFINTVGGLIRQPDGDPGARFEIVVSNTMRPQYFKYPRTVSSWSNAVIGLTNDGVRTFDGSRWTDDMSKDIRPDIDRIANGYTSSKAPAGAVMRRDSRMEYHLVYHDPQVSSGMNNRRMILNLDRVVFGSDPESGVVAVRAPWDRHDTGANYLVVDTGEDMYSAQSNDTTSVVYKERTDRMIDEGIYKGDTITSGVPTFIVRSGTFIPDIMAFVRLRQTRCLAQFVKAFSVRFQIVDRSTPASLTAFTPNTAGAFQLDVSRLGVDRLVANTPILNRQGLPVTLKGPAFYVEFTQTLEDKNFELLELTVHGAVIKTRKT